MYLCPKCDTLYCMNCARTLKVSGDTCWSCKAEIEVEVPQALMKQLTPSSPQGILETLTKYDATFNKAAVKRAIGLLNIMLSFSLIEII